MVVDVAGRRAEGQERTSRPQPRTDWTGRSSPGSGKSSATTDASNSPGATHREPSTSREPRVRCSSSDRRGGAAHPWGRSRHPHHPPPKPATGTPPTATATESRTCGARRTRSTPPPGTSTQTAPPATTTARLRLQPQPPIRRRRETQRPDLSRRTDPQRRWRVSGGAARKPQADALHSSTRPPTVAAKPRLHIRAPSAGRFEVERDLGSAVEGGPKNVDTGRRSNHADDLTVPRGVCVFDLGLRLFGRDGGYPLRTHICDRVHADGLDALSFSHPGRALSMGSFATFSSRALFWQESLTDGVVALGIARQT